MSQADNDSTTVTTTDHPRVFRAGPGFNRGELEIATDIADAIDDDWRIIITMGPHRRHNIHYNCKPESRIVHLDFYSVQPTTGYSKRQVISEIRMGIKQSEDLLEEVRGEAMAE
jgi:hypothetical protein